MTKNRHILNGLVLLALSVFNAQAETVDAATHDITVYADIVGKELLWTHEKSSAPDLQAMHSKKSGEWYFFDGKNRVAAKKLGTPWRTDGSTAGVLSAKSSVLNGYAASCITDAVGSSGIAGNFLTSYLILKSSNKWSVFTFSAQDGCDNVQLTDPKTIRFSYQKFDLKNPGRLAVHSVRIVYKNDNPTLVQTNVRFESNALIRKHFNAVKNSLSQ
jgi:hypothetical protein